ncbi:MAG: hypothetical protein CM15mP111_0200 [Hyphomicrobiales bacterium]|nr:MAG: hypothetical protein CM15mP111_0200 [Hyphomicrobiales bacterium]
MGYEKNITGSKKIKNFISFLGLKKNGKEIWGRLVGLLGGAALNYDVGVSLYSLGIPIYQGYGQTKGGPVISVNSPKIKDRSG